MSLKGVFPLDKFVSKMKKLSEAVKALINIKPGLSAKSVTY